MKPARPRIKAGQLRPLAGSSLQRNNLYPNAPTVAGSGEPGCEALSWSGISRATSIVASEPQRWSRVIKTVGIQPH